MAGSEPGSSGNLCLSPASLGRAQGWASVGVSSKLTPEKEESWSLKAPGDLSTKGSGFQKRKRAGSPLSGRLVFN